MIHTCKKMIGFTLIELMTVVVIIGILGAVALPAYKTYIVKSKISEAYSIMDEIGKSEISFYNDHAEFYDLDSNPTSIDAPMKIASLPGWDTFGYPIPVATDVYFSYQARAGKIDSGGTELATSTTTGYSFSTFSTNTLLEGTHTTPASTCNTGYTAADFGAVAQNSYDWAVVTAVGDLNQDGAATCTGIGRLVQIAASSGIPVGQSAFISFNSGD